MLLFLVTGPDIVPDRARNRGDVGEPAMRATAAAVRGGKEADLTRRGLIGHTRVEQTTASVTDVRDSGSVNLFAATSKTAL